MCSWVNLSDRKQIQTGRWKWDLCFAARMIWAQISRLPHCWIDLSDNRNRKHPRVSRQQTSYICLQQTSHINKKVNLPVFFGCNILHVVDVPIKLIAYRVYRAWPMVKWLSQFQFNSFVYMGAQDSSNQQICNPVGSIAPVCMIRGQPCYIL
jgi:hypothetical protein